MEHFSELLILVDHMGQLVTPLDNIKKDFDADYVYVKCLVAKVIDSYTGVKGRCRECIVDHEKLSSEYDDMPGMDKNLQIEWNKY